MDQTVYKFECKRVYLGKRTHMNFTSRGGLVTTREWTRKKSHTFSRGERLGRRRIRYKNIIKKRPERGGPSREPVLDFGEGLFWSRSLLGSSVPVCMNSKKSVLSLVQVGYVVRGSLGLCDRVTVRNPKKKIWTHILFHKLKRVTLYPLLLSGSLGCREVLIEVYQ